MVTVVCPWSWLCSSVSQIIIVGNTFKTLEKPTTEKESLALIEIAHTRLKFLTITNEIANLKGRPMENHSDSSSEEIVISKQSQEAAEVAKASIARYYTNMFNAIAERQKR